jgi:glycosyltransferase involved in cell wall biosynthesis
MYNGESISVIFPTFNEKESIKNAIDEFFATNLVDEIIVVNNNAAEGTSSEVAKTNAREIHEPRQGYGYALQKGMSEATGDIIILSEPDGTFSGHDIRKLLAYSEDVDVVFGTRTSTTFIWQGANMGLFLKWGNYFVGKMTEFLFNTTILTDVGCTMRLLRRNAYELVCKDFAVGSSHFGPHLMLLLITRGVKFVEIPVNYRQRIGESMVTGNFWKSFKLGIVMIAMVIKARLESLFCTNSIYSNSPEKKITNENYFETRMKADDRRSGVWKEIVRYLDDYFPPDDTVLELGAGYCDCINSIKSKRRIALDIWPDIEKHSATEVEVIIGSAEEITNIANASIDTIIASNLFEHMEVENLSKCFNRIKEVLKPDGKLLIIQPNHNLCADNYFDDPTHIQIFNEKTLCALLEKKGFEIEKIESRFLPFSMQSRLPAHPLLVRLYLHLPFRPLAGQMFISAALK